MKTPPIDVRPRLSFRRWLSHQASRGDPVGDLARDVLADRAADTRSPDNLARYLRERGVDERVTRAGQRARREYARHAT